MKIVQCDESVRFSGNLYVKLRDQVRRNVLLSRVIGDRWGKEY